MKKKSIFAIIISFLFMIVLASCNGPKTLPNRPVDDYTLTVTAPNGAPGVVLASLKQETNENINFISADTIGTAFVKKESDFVIAPVNAGAIQYTKLNNKTYQLAAVVTWGNLYFATQMENFTLSSINGKTLTLFGENTINSAIALYVLEKNNITPANVEYKGSAQITKELLVNDANAIVMTAEPLVSNASTAKTINSISISAEYKKLTGDEFTQAGLFVNSTRYNDHKELYDWFINCVDVSCNNANYDLDKTVEAVVANKIIGNKELAKKAIPNCSIKYVSAKNAKAAVEKTANINLALFGGALPVDGFYFN